MYPSFRRTPTAGVRFVVGSAWVGSTGAEPAGTAVFPTAPLHPTHPRAQEKRVVREPLVDGAELHLERLPDPLGSGAKCGELGTLELEKEQVRQGLLTLNANVPGRVVALVVLADATDHWLRSGKRNEQPNMMPSERPLGHNCRVLTH